MKLASINPKSSNSLPCIFNTGHFLIDRTVTSIANLLITHLSKVATDKIATVHDS